MRLAFSTVLLVLTESPDCVAAQPTQWPVDGDNTRITGTYGDYRIFPMNLAVFHDGIDIQKTPTAADPAGDLINLVGLGGQVTFVPNDNQSDAARASSDRTLIVHVPGGASYSYGHILEDKNVLQFDPVLGTWNSLSNSNIIVGQMHPGFQVGAGSPGPHLHFRVTDTATGRPLKHPLDSTILGSLPPARDAVPPEVERIFFWPDDHDPAGGGVSSDNLVVWGKVDVISRVFDSHGGRDSEGVPLNGGVWRVGYYLKDVAGNPIGAFTPSNPNFLIFNEFSQGIVDGVLGHENTSLVHTIFSRTFSNNATFYYTVTNRLHDGSPDDANRIPWYGIDPRGNLDTSLLPEGRNNACVAAWDHPDVLPDNPSNRTVAANECRSFIAMHAPIIMYDENANIEPLMESPPTGTTPQWARVQKPRFALLDPDGVVSFEILRAGVSKFKTDFLPRPQGPEKFVQVSMDGTEIDDSPEYYTARLTDSLGNVTNRYFLLDRRTPKADLGTALVDPGLGTAQLSGTVTDEGSGVAVAEFRPSGQQSSPYNGVSYPAASPSLGASGALDPGGHFLHGRDRSGQAGAPAPVSLNLEYFRPVGPCPPLVPDCNSGFIPGNGGNVLQQVRVNVVDFSVNTSGICDGQVQFPSLPNDVGSVSVRVRSEAAPANPSLAIAVTSAYGPTSWATVATSNGRGPQTLPVDGSLSHLAPLVEVETPISASTTPVAAQCVVTNPDNSTTTTDIIVGPGRITPVLGLVQSGLANPVVLDGISATVAGIDGETMGYQPVSGLYADVCIPPVCIKIPKMSGPGYVGAGEMPIQPPFGFHLTSKIRDIVVTAPYDGPLTFKMPHDYDFDFPSSLVAKSEMFHQVGASWQKITTQRLPDGLEGEATSTSLFMLAVKDGIPPTSTATFVGRSIELPDHTMLVSTRTGVVLSAFDPAVGDNVDTGVRASYYSAGGVFASTSQAGVTPFSGAPFTLPEGIVPLAFASEDHVHNVEAATMTIVAVDGTAPTSSLSVSGPVVVESSRVIVGPQTFFSLSAVDPVSNGVSAGTAAVAMLIDNTLEGCGLSLDGPPTIVPGAPPGSCGNPIYSAPFSIGSGSHTLGYFGLDNVLNAGILQSTSVIGDYAPPSVSFATAAIYSSPNPTLTAVLGDSLAGLATAALALTIDGAPMAFTPVYSGVGGTPPDTWATSSPLLNPIHLQGFALLGGRLYSIGGHDGSNNARADVNVAPIGPDGIPGDWAGTTPLPQGRNDLVAVPALGRLYALGGNPPGGGFATNTVYFAKPNGEGNIDDWDSAPLPESIAGLSAVGFTAAGTHLFAFGGYDGSGNPNAAVWSTELDGETGAPTTWSQLPDMLAPLAEAIAVAWAGRVYVLGGFAPNASFTSDKVYSAEILGRTLGPWRTERDMKLSVRALGAAAVQGRLYALGGLDSSGGVHREVYSAAIGSDGTLGSWDRESDLIRPLAAFGVASSELGIYIAGGYDGQAIVADTRYALGEPGTVLLARLSGTSAVTLGDGYHTVAAAGADRVANESAGSVQFFVDATPPVITLSAGSVALSTSATVFLANAAPLLRATFSDGDLPSGLNPSSVKLILDGSIVAENPPAPAQEISFTPSSPLASGRHTLKAVASDNAGNQSMLSADFIIDDVPPEVAVSSPAPGSIYGAAPFELRATLAEELSGLATVFLSVDGTTFPVTLSATGAGALGEWAQTPDLLAPIHIQGFALLGGRLYSVGGHDGTSGIRAEAYFATLGPDGLPDEWTATAPLPEPRAELVAVPALGRLYALGGIDGSGQRHDSVYYAMPEPDGRILEWETAALPGVTAGLAGAAFATSGTDIFAIGGVDGTGFASKTVRVSRLGPDGLPGPWDQLPDMLANVAQAPAVQAAGRLYILGGFSSDASAINNKVYSAKLEDYALTDWREELSMPLAVRLAGAAALQGKVYVLGGLNGTGGVHTEVFSAVVGDRGFLGSWQPEAQSLPTPLSAFGAANSDTGLYIAGGYDGTGIVRTARANLFVPPVAQTATAAVSGLAEGYRVAYATAMDLAGNMSFASAAFHVDLTAPETSLVVSGSSRVIGSAVFASTGVAVSFAAVDGPSSGAAGVALTRYAVGTDPAQDFTTNVLLDEGTWTLSFNSIDAVGNAESSMTATLKLDATQPGRALNLAAVALSSGDLRVSWTSPGDDGPAGDIADAQVRVDVRTADSGFTEVGARVVVASGPLAAGAPLSFVVSGLSEGVTYYASVFTRDTLGLWSEPSEPAVAATFFLQESTDGVVALYTPDSGATVAIVPIISATTAYAVAISSALEPVSAFYELNAVIPDQTTARLVFIVPGDFDLNSLAIYTFTTLGWSSASITNQLVTQLDGDFIEVSGEISHTSLYAVMVRDLTPPRTELSVSGTRFDLEGREFHRTPASATLTAQDFAPPGGTPSGVAATTFSLDGAPEQAYGGAFTLLEGRRIVEFRSIDMKGNAEAPRSSEVYVDASAPVLDATLDQPTASIPGGYAVVSPTAVLTLSALDPEVGGARSGLAEASYVLDGATMTLSITPGDATAGATVPLGTGIHTVLWRAADRVGHSAERSLRVSVGVGDASIPALSFSFPREDEPGLARLSQGTVTVRGSVFDDALASWEVRAGTVLLGSGTANASGKLGVWDGAAPSGLVTLRLSALDSGGNAAVTELNVYGGTPARVLALGGKSVLSSPRGVAWGPDRIYVADTGKDRIRVFDGAGALVATYGASSGPLKFGQPWGVAVDAAGNIYVADAGKKRIVKLAPNGTYLTEYGGTGVLKKPVAVALVPGKILVGDAKTGEIVAFAPDGTLLERVTLVDGPLAPPDPDDTPDDVRPMALAADAAGNVWVADARGGQALKYTAALAWAQTVGGFKRPEGIAVTPSGSVVAVSEAGTHRLSTYDAALGARLAIWGEQGVIKENKPLPAELLLKMPSQLAFTAGGNLLVADRGNDMIQGFGLPGTPLIAAMAGGSGGTHLAAFGDEGFGDGFGVAALDENFALRSVYAFPNPALGSQRPTVHVAVGKADKVTLRFYDVAGTPVHEATLDTPAVVNDEQGPQWAYEYAWQGHIPSGIYLYSVTAEKGGQAPIRRTGKLAVVR